MGEANFYYFTCLKRKKNFHSSTVTRRLVVDIIFFGNVP